jgi:hypothetical protein
VDRRILFVVVFCLTLISTLLVAFVCIMTEQTGLHTILYSLATMWIMGIVSQVLLQHVYLGIVRPLEEDKYEERLDRAKSQMNIDDIEEIDQVEELEEAMKKAQDLEASGR